MAENKREYICVFFKCCRIYQRIYLNASGKAFVGWCPRCAAQVVVRVDPYGSDDRFFSAR